MKKLIIALGLTLTLTATAFAIKPPFSDEATFDSWYKNQAVWLNNLGIMTGYPDGSFKPGNNVTRAELSVILTKFANYETKKSEEEFTRRLMNFMQAEESMKDLAIQGPYAASYKRLVLLAESGLLRSLEKPTRLDEFYKLNTQIKGLPEGYSVYELSNDGGTEYYLHYTGERDAGDHYYDANEWFGPYID